MNVTVIGAGLAGCEAAWQLAKRGIAVRSGLHCAPLAHRTAGTVETGTIRFSFSAFNHPDQVDQAAAAVRELARTAKK